MLHLSIVIVLEVKNRLQSIHLSVFKGELGIAIHLKLT